MERRALFTIGYEGLATAELIDRLRAAGVTRVVDVRERPLSRRKGFSKSALAELLKGVGIRYEHRRELGNPKPYRDRYKRGDIVGGTRAYRAHLHNGAYGAVIDLMDSLAAERTCLLCVEASHAACHRSVIADAIADALPNVAVVHL